MSLQKLTVNGRTYATRQKGPVVVICLDGADPAYLDAARSRGLVPTIDRWIREGSYQVGSAHLPTFTNPNNASIVTGVSPRLHGISGNHFFDRSCGEDVQMTAREFLRVPTILESFAELGRRVLSVTAKAKLSAFVSPGARGLTFSSEKPGEEGFRIAGHAPESVYSADASLWVLDAGVRAIEQGHFNLIYLSTTDYVQHKHAPESEEALQFFYEIDRRLDALDRLGAIVGVTADHGMNDKVDAAGGPNVVYLASILDAAIGEGTRVTLPITDPYVVHHGALGGCAMVYVAQDDIARARELLEQTPGVERVFDRHEAENELDLPPDRIGDLVVFAARSFVLGKRAHEHHLEHVAEGLRSHGSLHELPVPLLVNRNVMEPAEKLRNSDIFDLVLNRS